MSRGDLAREVTELGEPIALRHGVELVAVEVRGAGRYTMLRVMIDKPGGVTVGDCATFSEALGPHLDARDLFAHGYTLEVSSPGLDRPLRALGDYDRFAGRRVALRTLAPVDGQRHFVGRLEGVRDGRVRVRLDDGREASISPEAIAGARLEVDEAELRADLRRSGDDGGRRHGE